MTTKTKRQKLLELLRDEIPTIAHGQESSSVEEIQNLVLRPILKTQHRVIIRQFELLLKQQKIPFDTYDNLKKQQIISSAFEKNIAWRSIIQGMVLGMCTEEEMRHIMLFHKEIGKRIRTMAKQRICSEYNLD